jgi:hypothetical protein
MNLKRREMSVEASSEQHMAAERVIEQFYDGCEDLDVKKAEFEPSGSGPMVAI